MLTILLGNELMFRTTLESASRWFTDPGQEILLAEAGIEHAMFEFGSAAVYGYGGNADPTWGSFDGDFGALASGSPATGINELTDGDVANSGWRSTPTPWPASPPYPYTNYLNYCRAYAPGATNCYQYTFPLRTGDRNNTSQTNILGRVQANVVNPYSRWPVIFSRARIGNNTNFSTGVDRRHVGRTVRVELERPGNNTTNTTIHPIPPNSPDYYHFAIFTRQAAAVRPPATAQDNNANQPGDANPCVGFQLTGGAYVGAYNNNNDPTCFRPFSNTCAAGTRISMADVATHCYVSDASLSSDLTRPGFIDGGGASYNPSLAGGIDERTSIDGCVYFGSGGGTSYDRNVNKTNGYTGLIYGASCGANDRKPLLAEGNFPTPPLPLSHRCTELGVISLVSDQALPITGGQTYCATSISVQGSGAFPTHLVFDNPSGTVTKIYVRDYVHVNHGQILSGAAANGSGASYDPTKVQLYVLATNPLSSPAACNGKHVCIRGTGSDVRAYIYTPTGNVLLTEGQASPNIATAIGRGPIVRGAIIANQVIMNQFAKMYYYTPLATSTSLDYGLNTANAYAAPKIRSWQVISDP